MRVLVVIGPGEFESAEAKRMGDDETERLDLAAEAAARADIIGLLQARAHMP